MSKHPDAVERTTSSVNEGSGQPEQRGGDWMQTFSGGQFWPMDPRVEEVRAIDIAHSLSMQCRYAGHCLQFYSVAEHSVLMTRWLHGVGESHAVQKWALLHDAAEAYLVDVPRPVKPFLPGYKEAESAVMLAVAQRFGLSGDMPSVVKDADNRILVDESRVNMAPCVADWELPWEPLGVQLHFWAPWEAKKAFVDELTRMDIYAAVRS